MLNRLLQVTTYHRKQVFLGEDARDLLGQKGLDHNRRESFQGASSCIPVYFEALCLLLCFRCLYVFYMAER